MDTRKLIFIAGLMGLTAVAFGAFGAHALAGKLAAYKLTAVFETASKYHFYHGFALFSCAFLKPYAPEKKLNYAAWCFLGGIVIFSGSLYVMCLTNIRWLGAITPIGGLLLMTGWLMIIISVLKNKNA